MQQIKKEFDLKQKNANIRIMFQDEARFGLINSLSGCWAPKGIRPEVLMKLTRQYTYAYAAVSPKDGQMVSLVLPYANTEAMTLFLSEVSKRFKDDYNVIFMDQAGWHKSRNLEIPENIRIEFLPPYSPQLNPTEHVWDELREKDFKNRYFADMQQVDDQLCEGLEKLENNPEKIRGITGFSWILDAVC